MKSDAESVEEYIKSVPEDKKEALLKLRDTINNSISQEFHEEMSYGMIGWVVPKSLYPKGYHCNPKLPLPFINLGVQKKFIGFYHLGIYSDKDILSWFREEWSKQCSYKLDMGKSCIRLKKLNSIPYKLLGELCKKITAEEWIAIYEKAHL